MERLAIVRHTRELTLLMTDRDTIMCIYCLEQRAPSREHVLQESLGGDIVIRDLCVDCNARFSAIDQALAESSVISLDRLMARSGVRVNLGPTHLLFDEDAGLWKDVRIRNRFSPELLPQLHLRGNELSIVGADRPSIDALIDLLRERVAKKTVADIHVKIDEQYGSSRITRPRPKRRDLVLRAPSHDEAGKLVRYVQDHFDEVEAIVAGDPVASTIENPRVHGRMVYDFNASHRAVAKVAMNFLAYSLGAPYVLDESFDALRNYIRGDDLRIPDVSEEQLAIDRRFVAWLQDAPTIPRIPDRHTIYVTNVRDALCAVVVFYGKKTFLVKLREADHDVDPIGRTFTFDGTPSQVLEMPEWVELLQSRERFD